MPRDSVEALLVDLRSCGTVTGALRGLVPSSVTVTEGYYTDTRVQAKLSTVTRDGDDGWDGGRIRVVHSRPGLRESLVTGYVTDYDETVEGGLVRREYTLDSSLYAISKDLFPWKYSVGGQASMVEAVRHVLDMCGREHDLSRARDRRVQGTVVYDLGESALSVVFDLAGDTDRVGVDGEGRIVLTPYTPPSGREPGTTIDTAGPMVVGQVKATTSRYQTPGRVIVRSGSGDGERWGTYDAPAGAASSSASRGYMVATVETSTAREPSQQDLDAAARRSWEASQDTGEEWELTVVGIGLHQGDVVRLVHEGRAHRCLVKSATLSLSSMSEKLTLKGV